MSPSTSPWFRQCLLILALAAPLTVEGRAAAQSAATAAALFDHGVEQMNAGHYPEGCPAIAESHRLDPRAGTLFTLALCEDRWGHTASAVAYYADYLSLYERLPDDKKPAQGERPKVAKERRDKLAPDVPELTLVLPPGAPTGTVVKRDGQPMAAAALGIGLPVDPGEHTVSTEGPGGLMWEQSITMAKGEKKKVSLEVRAPPRIDPRAVVTPLPPQPTRAKGTSGRRVAAYVTGSIGVAGLALGGVMGGLALGQKSTINQYCPDPKGTGACTDQRGVDAGNAAKSFALGSTIGFAAGAAGVVTAAVLFLTEPKRPKPTTGARSPWISATVLPAGPAGAMIGAQGAW